jgi:teichuronic acid biosynthesis glycosyltransferase TuaH
MPYKSSPYNDAVFPLKLFEFLAAGISVVGVHLPSTKKYEEASVYTCLDSGDPEQLIRVCEQMEHGNDNQTAVERRKALARSKDWPAIFTQMMEAL